MRRNLLTYSILICSIVILIIGYSQFSDRTRSADTTIYMEEVGAEIGTEENPQARLEYENSRLVDPATGEIPLAIRDLEREFAKTLPKGFSGFKAPLSVAAGSESSQAAEFTFVNRGPTNVGGRTRALAIDVTDEDVWFAGGVSGGLWRTADAGDSWTRVTPVGSFPSVTAIVQDTREGNENIWFYGTGEFSGNSANAPGARYRGDGIFRSDDGGLTWTPISSTTTGDITEFHDFSFVHELAIDTSNPNLNEIEVYAAIGNAIVRSTDGFTTFEKVVGGGNQDFNWSDVVVSSTGRVIATLGTNAESAANEERQVGLWTSLDGLEWVDITPEQDFPNFSRMEIGLSASNEDVFYLLTSSTLHKYDFAQGSSINLSGNLQRNLTGVTSGYNSQGNYDMAVKVHPADENVVYVLGTNILRSSDGWSTSDEIDHIGGYVEGVAAFYNNHHPDQHNLAFFPSDPDKMLSSNDGGVFLTRDNRESLVVYSSENNGFVTTQFYAIAANLNNAADAGVMGGTQDNGSWMTVSDDPSRNWISVFGGDGSFCYINDFSLIFSTQNGNIGRGNFTPESLGPPSGPFASISPIGSDGREDEFLFINPFTVDRVNQERAYIAGKSRFFFTNNVTSNPNGTQWTFVDIDAGSNSQVSALETSINPEGILWLGTNFGELFKVEDVTDIESVTKIDRGAAGITTNGNISSIGIDPDNADNVILSFSNYNVNSIWFTQDGGSSFTAVSGNLEEDRDPSGVGSGPSVNWVDILDNGEGSIFLAGTSVGLYATEELDGMNTTWTQVASDVIGSAVIDMIRVRQVDGTIFVGSHGNGIFTGRANTPLKATISYREDLQNQIITLYGNLFRPTSEYSPAYQWQRDGEDIDGATERALEVPGNGTYTLRITDLNTQSTSVSNPIVIGSNNGGGGDDDDDDIVTDIDDPFVPTDGEITVLDNPSNGRFGLILNANYVNGFELQVVDASGNQVLVDSRGNYVLGETLELNLENVPSGLYILNIANDKAKNVVKLYKSE